MKKLTAALLVFLMMVMTGAMALAYTEGTYTATAQGNNGPVTVSVTFSADAITDVTVVEHIVRSRRSRPPSWKTSPSRWILCPARPTPPTPS